MIKSRQDSQILSSSSRRGQTPPPPDKAKAATVGCMSGIFKLISKYQNRKKLLTFGKKVEKKATSVATKRANGMVKDEENIYINKHVVPRSPILSPRLRKPNAEKVPENNRKTPVATAVVDGMMAAKEEEHEQPVIGWGKEEASEKKRQKLLEALEKCNEDLEALKMIIKAVKPLAEAAPPPCVVVDSVEGGGGGGGAVEKCIKNENVRSEQWNNSSFTSFKCHGNEENTKQHGGRISQPKTKPEKHNRIGARCFSRFVKEPYGSIRRKPVSNNEAWASNAMVQSVEEVCNDIIWGEKREVANIGVMLHNHICRDLIEETINELGFHKMYRFPLHGCKRRLSF